MFSNPRNKSIGKLSSDAIGCYHHISSDVYHSATYVALYSGNCSHPSGKWSITKDNLERIVTVFSARKLVSDEWYNDKDIFLSPNTDHPAWKEFYFNSLVYSLFHSSSHQSSLRGVDFLGEKYNIMNEFFFMSRDIILELANTHSNMDCFQDARTDKDRYVFQLLSDISLPEESKIVLKKARALVESSFPFRDIFNLEHPEYQINNWDSGWYQIKALLKIYDPKGLNEFQALFNALSEKMKPLVYELGFLK